MIISVGECLDIHKIMLFQLIRSKFILLLADHIHQALDNVFYELFPLLQFTKKEIIAISKEDDLLITYRAFQRVNYCIANVHDISETIILLHQAKQI